jgi:NAD(P)-dependent dehydrogenase (short-subunit alcohol dehydrogenase family)
MYAIAPVQKTSRKYMVTSAEILPRTVHFAVFVKSLAKQLGPKGIRVNGVAPGPIWTALQVSGGRKEPPAHLQFPEIATMLHG